MSYVLSFGFETEEEMVAFFRDTFRYHDIETGLFKSDAIDRERRSSKVYVARTVHGNARVSEPVSTIGGLS